MTQYRTPTPVCRMQVLDQASRSPWWAVEILCTTPSLATARALLTAMPMVIDPFAEQSLLLLRAVYMLQLEWPTRKRPKNTFLLRQIRATRATIIVGMPIWDWIIQCRLPCQRTSPWWQNVHRISKTVFIKTSPSFSTRHHLASYIQKGLNWTSGTTNHPSAFA